jgi:uncharacterized protein YneR
LKIASTWANRDVIGYVMSYVPTFKGYEVPSHIVSKKHATEMKPVCFLDEDDYWYYEKEKKRENLEHLEDEYDGYHH